MNVHTSTFAPSQTKITVKQQQNFFWRHKPTRTKRPGEEKTHNRRKLNLTPAMEKAENQSDFHCLDFSRGQGTVTLGSPGTSGEWVRTRLREVGWQSEKQCQSPATLWTAGGAGLLRAFNKLRCRVSWDCPKRWFTRPCVITFWSSKHFVFYLLLSWGTQLGQCCKN